MQQPPYLKKNDYISIVSPAGKIDAALLINAVKHLERWGLRVKMGAHATAQYMGFAGTDEERRTDLQAAINDPEIKAILCARGGYGCGRIIDDIDFSPLVQSPKWLVGFSDVTLIHARLQRLGLQSIHGAMPKTFPTDSNESESTHTLRQALFGELTEYTIAAHPLNKYGKVRGRLTGGNLSMLLNIAATPDDCWSDNSILFIEDVSEFHYHLDRMLNNLQRSGKLQRLAGLIVGHFTTMKADEIIVGKTAGEIIDGYAAPLGIPVCYGFPAGHEEPNYAMYFGRQVQLELTNTYTKLIF